MGGAKRPVFCEKGFYDLPGRSSFCRKKRPEKRSLTGPKEKRTSACWREGRFLRKKDLPLGRAFSGEAKELFGTNAQEGRSSLNYPEGKVMTLAGRAEDAESKRKKRIDGGELEKPATMQKEG